MAARCYTSHWMKAISLLITISLIATCSVSLAQVKKGGLFGLSRSDELSSELFPNVAPTAEPVTSADIDEIAAAPKDQKQGFNIFRGGKPKKVDDVSYEIADGEIIEKELAPQPIKAEAAPKKGLFSFGKKKQEVTEEINEEVGKVIESVPSVPTAPITNIPSTARITAPSIPGTSTVAAPEIIAATNVVAEEVKETKSKKRFPFFGKKSNPVPVDLPVGTVAVGTAPEAVVALQTPKPATGSAPKPAASPIHKVVPIEPVGEPVGKPEAASAPTVASADTIPKFEESKPEKKEGGFLSPITKLMPEKKTKTIDLTGAETIIQDGEIVVGSETTIENIASSSEAIGERAPPQIINGVKTYSSWDDIDATNVSAASKILERMR